MEFVRVFFVFFVFEQNAFWIVPFLSLFWRFTADKNDSKMRKRVEVELNSPHCSLKGFISYD